MFTQGDYLNMVLFDINLSNCVLSAMIALAILWQGHIDCLWLPLISFEFLALFLSTFPP